MSGQRSVLVVEADSAELANTVALLQTAGYRVSAASGFDEAKQQLAMAPPDLLITGLRLGPYNGLHLILRSRVEHPRMGAIVTSRYRDAVLEAEAQRQNADFLLRPLDDIAFLQAVSRSLGTTGPVSPDGTGAPIPSALL